MSPYGSEKTRYSNSLPVAKEGFSFILIGCVFLLLFLFMGFFWHTSLFYASFFMGIITLFLIIFFRDPNRECPVQEKTALTPADGKVLDICYLKDANNPLGEPAIKISIFMSLFNVHVNRVPISGKISRISYSPGKFFSANLDKASKQNENNRITVQTDDGRKIIFVQIAGLIARRIVCWIKERDNVEAGQRCGLIRFGSRVDVYLPGDSHIIAKPKDKVKAGETILGYLS